MPRGKTTKPAPQTESPEQPGTDLMPVKSMEVATPEETKERAAKYLQMLGTPLNDEETSVFIDICKAYALNPFTREVYGIPRWDKDKKRNVLTIVVGYEVYLKRAERTGLLKGWKCWTEGQGASMKAICEIKRAGWDEPFRHEVLFPEYCQYRYDSDKRQYVATTFWKNKPATMLKKVAIGQAFRLCFPEHIGGMPYAQEEVVTDEYAVSGGDIPKNARETGHEVVEDAATAAPQPETPAEAASPAAESAERAKAGPQPRPGSTDEQTATEPAEEETQTVAQRYMELSDELQSAGLLGDFWRFMVAKHWIRDGQSLDDLTENQITRLCNNKVTLMHLFEKWRIENPKGGNDGSAVPK